MSSKRGRNRNSGAVSDKRENDSKGSPKESESESEKPEVPLRFEYETEDGLKIELDPFEAEISREYQISEEDFIEFSAGIDWSPADLKIEKRKGDISVSGEVGLPGDLLGISGGIIIDLSTGEISGGEIGVEIAGVDIEVEVSGEKGCQKSISFSIFGFGVGYTRDDCDKNEETKPPPGQGSEDEARRSPGGGMSTEDLRKKMPNSLCAAIRFSISYTRIRTFELDENGYRKLDERGFTIPPEIVIQGGLEGYERLYVYTKNWGTTTVYHGTRYLKESRDPNVHSIYSLFADGMVIWEYPNPHEHGPNYNPNVKVLYPKQSPDEGDYMDSSIFDIAQVHEILDVDSGCDIFDIRPYRNRPRIPPSPPPTRKMDNCCRESTKLMRDIHEVLACREILSKGFETPNRWIVAGGKKYTKHKDYLSIIEFQMRMQDHLGIHPFRAEVTDTNAAQEGNQSAAVEFANATAAVKQIAELLLENKGDSATRLNLMIRTAIAVGQVLNVVSIISKTIEGIVQYLGMPIRERVFKVKMPFDFTFGARSESTKGKGFGKGTQKGVNKLDINTEEATEALLPKFMQDTEQPIIVEDFDDRANDLTDIIKGK